MTSVGMANAINIRIGKYIGSGLLFGTQMIAKCAIILNTVTMITIGLFLYFTRNVFITIWTDNVDVIKLSSSLIAVGLIPRMLI